MAVTHAKALAERLRVTFYDNAFDAVQREAEASLQADPENRVAQAWRARALYKEGRFADAAEAFRALPSDDAETLVAHGDYQLYIGDTTRSKELFRRALSFDADHLDALMGLASAHVTLEQADLADELARRAQPQIARDDAYEQARLLIVQGGVAGLKAQRGGLFDKLRHGPWVKDSFLQAIRIHPHSPYGHYALGRFYREAPGAVGGSLSKAIASFRDAVAADPYFHPAHVLLIFSLEEAHEAEGAADELAAYRLKFADNPHALNAVNYVG